MNFNLIVPIAGDRPEYENNIPPVFTLDREGFSLCIKAILGLDLSKFDNIYFTILLKHNKIYSLKELLEMQFRRLNINATVVVLPESTRNQAETIYKTILLEKIQGGIYIKDSDGYYVHSNISNTNSITVFPLDELELVCPSNKSYVDFDDQFFITNIIEKKIINRYFNAGGYIFSDSNSFVDYYLRLKNYSKLYLSHIVYNMLLDGMSFRPQIINGYIDWGNQTSINYYISK